MRFFLYEITILKNTLLLGKDWQVPVLLDNSRLLYTEEYFKNNRKHFDSVHLTN